MRRTRNGRSSYAAAGALLGTVFLLVVSFVLGSFWGGSRKPVSHSEPQNNVERGWAFQGGQTDTLVVYIFSNTDPMYLVNLKFFLRWGVREGDGADYVVVLQQDGAEVSTIRPLSEAISGLFHVLLVINAPPYLACCRKPSSRLPPLAITHVFLCYLLGCCQRLKLRCLDRLWLS